MSYETIAGSTQTIALVLFFIVFLVIVAYALWPGNRDKFERAARLPLEGASGPDEFENKNSSAGDRNG